MCEKYNFFFIVEHHPSYTAHHLFQKTNQQTKFMYKNETMIKNLRYHTKILVEIKYVYEEIRQYE